MHVDPQVNLFEQTKHSNQPYQTGQFPEVNKESCEWDLDGRRVKLNV